MKNHQPIRGLLLLLLCLTLVGCRSSTEESVSTEAMNITDTSGSAEAKASTDADARSDRDTYKTLAETNIVLRKQLKQWIMESNYYEVMYMNRSSQILQNKDIDYQTNITENSQNKAGTEDLPPQYVQPEIDYQADISIPEIDDSELSNRIAELQAENDELTTEIENLREDISLYKRLLGYDYINQAER